MLRKFFIKVLRKSTTALAGVGALILFSGCASETPRPTTPYKAQVLSFVENRETASGRWTVSEQTLPTLEDPDTLRGRYFEILTGRKLAIDSSLGSLITGRISGTESSTPARYNVKNGVIYPRDTTTLLMFSSFHAFEKIFERVEAISGKTTDDLKNAIGGRYRILFEPTIEASEQGTEARLSLKMNAAFNSENNDFILFRRSAFEKIPLAANLKVLSHEFGHALFKDAFFRQKAEACPQADAATINQRSSDKFFTGRLNIEYALLGLNEGFADFVSYVLTGDVNPLEGSFTNLDITSRSLKGPKFIFSQLADDKICSGRFYCIGTLFARALYAAAPVNTKSTDELMAYSRRVYAALQKTPDYLKEKPAVDVLPSPSKDVSECKRRDSISPTYDGAVSGAFLAAFLSGFPSGTEKTAICDNLTQLFGSTGFPQEARSVCNP